MNRGTGSLALALLPLLILAVSACGGGSDDLAFGLKSDVVASGDRPYVMAFAPDGRLFYGEQYSGAIRVVGADGIAQADPFAQLQVQTYIDLDWGLTGIALDPDFQTNHYVYAFYTEPVDPSMPTGRPKLVRFTDQNGRGDAETVISDNFPVTSPQHQGYNANGRLHFGPDGFLYLSIGDYDTPDPVQDLSEPIGKLLRVKKEDGSAAPGNPYLENPAADPRIFAIGFREPFDLAFQPATKAIFGTDNTPYSCEELNIITAGANYGWPNVGEFPFADCSAGAGVQAISHFAREGKQPGDFLSFVEVSGLAFALGDKYPALGPSLMVCEPQHSIVDNQRSPGVLRRLVLGASGVEVTASDLIVNDCKGDVAVSPDGFIYYSNDTEIRKLIPGQPAS